MNDAAPEEQRGDDQSENDLGAEDLLEGEPAKEDSAEDAPVGEDLIKEFLSTYDRLRTRKSYGHDLRDFFGKEKVSSAEAKAVSGERVARYLQEVGREKGKSALKRRRAAIRSFYKWAGKQGHLPGELVERVDEGLSQSPSE